MNETDAPGQVGTVSLVNMGDGEFEAALQGNMPLNTMYEQLGVLRDRIASSMLTWSESRAAGDRIAGKAMAAEEAGTPLGAEGMAAALYEEILSLDSAAQPGVTVQLDGSTITVTQGDKEFSLDVKALVPSDLTDEGLMALLEPLVGKA